jgi:hypothetical protein
MWSFIVYLNYHVGSWPEYIAKFGRGQEEKYHGSSNAAAVISLVYEVSFYQGMQVSPLLRVGGKNRCPQTETKLTY